MDPHILENGLKIIWRGKVFSYGQMEENLMVNGVKIKFAAEVHTLGQMAEVTKVTILMTRSMDMESIHGLMERNTMDNG